MTPPGPLRADRPTPSFSPEFDQPFSLVPGLGQGWFGEPGLKAHRAGRDWTFQTTDCAVERDGPRALVTLTDAVARIAVAVSLTLDPDSDVLTVSTTLINRGDAPLDAQWLAAAVRLLPDHARRVR